MSRVYASAADHINTHPYAVLVSPLYSPYMPSVYSTGELEPIYTNPTPMHPVRSMLPIKYLIDLHSTRQSFSIIDDLDVIRVFHSLDAYLLEIKDSVFINPDVKLYARKVLELRKQAYKNFVRMLNLHPEWHAAYGQGTDKLLRLLEMFAVPDFNARRALLDPIEQLRAPPIDLDEATPSTKQGSATTNISGIPYYYA